MVKTDYRRAASRYYWGDGVRAALPRELDRAGVRSVVAVCGPGTAKDRTTWQAISSAAGSRVVSVFAGVEHQSPRDSVAAVAACIADHAADAVLAVGGGSAIVTARSAVLGLHDSEPRPSGAPLLPLFVWLTNPTTAAATAGSAVTEPDTLDRLAGFDPAARARAVFVPPRSARPHLPASVVWPAVVTSFAMTVEGLLSPEATYFTDGPLSVAARALLHVMRGGDVEEALETATFLATLDAGLHAELAGCGLCAALSHVIGHVAGVRNGVLDAVLLPGVLAHAAEKAPGTIERLSRLLQEPDPADCLRSVSEQLGLPRRLREIGLRRADLPAFAAAATRDHAARTSPFPVDTDVAASLLAAMW